MGNLRNLRGAFTRERREAFADSVLLYFLLYFPFQVPPKDVVVPGRPASVDYLPCSRRGLRAVVPVRVRRHLLRRPVLLLHRLYMLLFDSYKFGRHFRLC